MGKALEVTTSLSDERLVTWLSELRYNEIPRSIVDDAKRAILDTLAVGWAAHQASGVGSVLAWIRGAGPGQCRLWGEDIYLPATAAALGNGLLSAALDFDIVHEGSTAHSHIVILPALLALGEELGADGKDFLSAYIGACEMAVRLGRGVRHNPGWLGSSVFGVLAAAAGCARLLQLPPHLIRAAVGLASSRAAGTQQPLIEGASSKRLQTAFAARDAIECARLAQSGVTAPSRWFTGNAGFRSLYLDLSSEPEARLGSDWYFTAGILKKFPSCLANHAAIVATQRASGGPTELDSVHACRVRLPPFSARLVGGPFDPDGCPQVAAQFSVRYSVACTLARGSVTLADLSPLAVLDKKIGDFARRMVVEVDYLIKDDYVPAVVELEFADGSCRMARVDTIPGSSTAFSCEHEWRSKAEDCFRRGPAPLAGAQFEQLEHTVYRLEHIADIRTFW